MKKIFFLSLITFILSSADVFAGKRYYIMGVAGTWNTTLSWSATSGGASGASVPGSSDTVYFDGNGVGACTLDANVNVKRLESASGYTGTIVQGLFTVTLGTSTLSGGTFLGGTASITCSGPFVISGCAFTSTSGTFSTSSDFTLSSGSFSHNNGTVTFTATNTISGSIGFYNLTFNPSSTSTYTISNTISVSATLTLSGTAGLSLNTGTINAKGNITVTNTGGSGGGSATIVTNGTGTQTFTGPGGYGQGRLCNIQINKSASDTLKLVSIITIAGNWTYTAGIINAGTSTVYFLGTKTISGTHTLYNVQFSGAGGSTFTISSGTTLTVNGLLTIAGGGLGMVINTGSIYAKGDITNTNTTLASGGSATITINGTGNQTFTGGSSDGHARMPHVVINKTSGTLTLSGVISPGGNWTYTAGTIAAGTSTIFFNSAKTITGSHTLNNVGFSGAGAYTYTIASGTTLTAAGNLYFTGTSAITLNTGQINAQDTITMSNTSTGTGGSATIVINGSGEQALTGSGTAGAGKFPNITIDKTGGVLALQSIISCTGNWIYVKGNVSPGSSSVALYGTYNLDGQTEGQSSTMAFYRCQVSSGTRTLTGSIDCNDNFTISTGATCKASTRTISIGGNFINQGTWNYDTSIVVFDGVGYNKIQATDGTTINFANVTFNRRSGKSVTIKNPVIINTNATFTLGRVKTDTTNYLQFADNATCTVTNNDSAYVHGPVRKTGNDAFTFPLGDTTLHDSIAYHPLAITAPGSVSDRFMAQYYANKHLVGDSLVDSLANVSDYEYWSLNRQVGSSNVIVTLSWNRNSQNVQDYNTLRIANWNGTKWLDLGGTNVSVNNRTGSVTAVAPSSYVSNSAILTVANMVWTQDYAVLHRKLDGGYYLVKNGALYFTYDEEYNDTDDKLSFTIYDQQRRVVASSSGSYAITKTSDYGDNRFFINLFDCNTNANGSLGAGTFILEVTNEKNEKWMLRFKHVTTITPNCSGGGGGGQ